MTPEQIAIAIGIQCVAFFAMTWLAIHSAGRAADWQSRCNTAMQANAELIRDRDRAQAQVAELTIERDEADQSASHAYERLRALEHERHEGFAERHDRIGVDSL